MLGKTSLKTKDLYRLVLLPVLILVTFALALYALHDLQTAEGAGLYLSMMLNHPTRTLCDMLMDIAGMILLLLALLLPCVLTHSFHLEAFFRFMTAYFAFMPIMYPGRLVHILEDFSSFALRSSIYELDILQILFVDGKLLFTSFQALVPFLVLLCAINRLQNQSGKRYNKWFLLSVIVLTILYMLFDNIAHLCSYWICYILLIWCFLEWESSIRTISSLNKWSRILFMGFLLRGIYRMLMLVSMAQI